MPGLQEWFSCAQMLLAPSRLTPLFPSLHGHFPGPYPSRASLLRRRLLLHRQCTVCRRVPLTPVQGKKPPCACDPSWSCFQAEVAAGERAVGAEGPSTLLSCSAGVHVVVPMGPLSICVLSASSSDCQPCLLPPRSSLVWFGHLDLARAKATGLWAWLGFCLTN